MVWEEGIFGLKPARGTEAGEGGRRKSLKREREEEEGPEGDGDASRVGGGPEEMLRSQSRGDGVGELDVVDLEGAVEEGEGEEANGDGEGEGGGSDDQEDEFGDDSWMNGMGADAWGAMDGGVTSGTI